MEALSDLVGEEIIDWTEGYFLGATSIATSIAPSGPGVRYLVESFGLFVEYGGGEPEEFFCLCIIDVTTFYLNTFFIFFNKVQLRLKLIDDLHLASDRGDII